MSRWPVAGTSEYWLPASSPSVKRKSNAHAVQQIHIRWLQQYTRPTNNNYTQDNLKLSTIHKRTSSQILDLISTLQDLCSFLIQTSYLSSDSNVFFLTAYFTRSADVTEHGMRLYNAEQRHDTSLCNEPDSYVNAFCVGPPFHWAPTPFFFSFTNCARHARTPTATCRNKTTTAKRSHSYQIFIKQQNGKFTCHILNQAMISAPSVSIHETVLKSVQY